MSQIEFPVRVGRCVYCGTSKGPLTAEHVIPYALNGTWQLLEASCGEHSNITKRFESSVLRGAFLPVRAKLGLRTRRKKNRPKQFSTRFATGDGEVALNLPASEHPGFLVFPVFGSPGHVPDESPIPGLELRTFGYIYHRPSLERLKAQLAPKSATVTFPDLIAFARMLAKIGYCFAVARVGLDAVIDSPVLNFIKGEDPQVGRYVGNLDTDPVNTAEGIHQVTLLWNSTRMVAHVRLFAPLKTPEYTVLLRSES